ncbi:MAG: RNA polymerase sigma factor [Acidimicrobiales bacterium]
MGRPSGFDSFEGLVGWVIKVAWNEVQMEWRRRARTSPGEVLERPGGPDPAEVAEARVTLEAVAHGIAALNEAERDAILSVLVDEPGARGPQSAVAKMRRHRARKHLAALIDSQNVAALGNDTVLGTAVADRPATRQRDQT